MSIQSEYSINQIQIWVEEYKQTNNKYPNAVSGNVPGTNVSWDHINNYLKNSKQGLKGYNSLLSFIRTNCIG